MVSAAQRQGSRCPSRNVVCPCMLLGRESQLATPKPCLRPQGLAGTQSSRCNLAPLKAVSRHFDHCAVQHAIPEVGKDHRRCLFKEELLPPLLETRQKEASPRGDGSKQAVRI